MCWKSFVITLLRSALLLYISAVIICSSDNDDDNDVQGWRSQEIFVCLLMNTPLGGAIITIWCFECNIVVQHFIIFFFLGFIFSLKGEGAAGGWVGVQCNHHCASITQRWWTQHGVKSNLLGWIITLSSFSPHFSNQSQTSNVSDSLRCYTVAAQVWILGYKSSEPCRPTERDPESRATALWVYMCVCMCIYILC